MIAIFICPCNIMWLLQPAVILSVFSYSPSFHSFFVGMIPISGRLESYTGLVACRSLQDWGAKPENVSCKVWESCRGQSASFRRGNKKILTLRFTVLVALKRTFLLNQ